MDKPNDVKDLQSFLGLANYLSRFTPHLADVLAPLCDLHKQDVEFLWGLQHAKAFQTLKIIVSSPKVLKYYDSTNHLYFKLMQVRDVSVLHLYSLAIVAYQIPHRDRAMPMTF